MRLMLTVSDREEISRGLAEGLEYRQIAVLIGRNPSVVCREVARHGWRGGYRAMAADSAAALSRRRLKELVVDRTPRLRSRVHTLLRCGWSPVSIAGRLPIDYPGDQAYRVSHEVIHQGRPIHAEESRVSSSESPLPDPSWSAASIEWRASARRRAHP